MFNEKFALAIIVMLIFILGVYPQYMLNISNETVDAILKKQM